MSKPQPIAEIVVKESKHSSKTLEITVASFDATEWVRSNATEFGMLFEYHSAAVVENFQLKISELYKTEDVATYLRTLGASENDASPTAFDTALPSEDAMGEPKR